MKETLKKIGIGIVGGTLGFSAVILYVFLSLIPLAVTTLIGLAVLDWLNVINVF